MSSLVALVRFEAIALTIGFLVAVLYQVLTGRIQLDGIFANKTTGVFDPGRLQVLVFTLFAAAAIFSTVGTKTAASDLTGASKASLSLLGVKTARGVLALPSDSLLYLLGGSQGLYLVRKLLQTYISPRGE